jgi:hypothetical protein
VGCPSGKFYFSCYIVESKSDKNRFINIVLERVIEMLIIKEPHIYRPDNQKISKTLNLICC